MDLRDVILGYFFVLVLFIAAGALLPFPPAYYAILRWTYTLASLYGAIVFWGEVPLFRYLFIASALIHNPIIPVWLHDKLLWAPLNFATAALFLIGSTGYEEYTEGEKIRDWPGLVILRRILGGAVRLPVRLFTFLARTYLPAAVIVCGFALYIGDYRRLQLDAYEVALAMSMMTVVASLPVWIVAWLIWRQKAWRLQSLGTIAAIGICLTLVVFLDPKTTSGNAPYSQNPGSTASSPSSNPRNAPQVASARSRPLQTDTQYAEHAIQMIESRDWVRALQLAREWQQDNPAHPDAWGVAGLAYQGLGYTEQAARHYEYALKLRPASRVYRDRLKSLLADVNR